MAEAIVSTILEQLRTVAIENAREEWRLVTGIEKEVKRLEGNFEAIQHVLEDAEEKRLMDKGVEHWLDRFKEVSYDMEDVLDEWKTALTSVRKWKVCPFVSCLPFVSQVVRRHDIATRIKEINKDLDQIAEDKGKLQLIKRETKQPKRPESVSFVDVSQIYGRDGVKEDIIRRLLLGTGEEETRNNIATITIVGMGGIGKTALAQLIYNDERVQTHFNKTMVWVCVSDPFDQKQIARAILGGLDPNSTSFQNPTLALQTLLTEISEKIRGKKFFFVLDDVWTDRVDDWQSLKATFQCGMPGSWILVTTRKKPVARQEDLHNVFLLDVLSEDISWMILAQKAENRDRRESFEDIGKEIAKKCKGLPLAAKALGGLLQDKLRREEWQNVLNSVIWKLNFAQETWQEIFTPLLLSYHDLPSRIRRCLLYCAIFPKDCPIGKDELIQHWMAQGYLNSNDCFGRELEGEHYFMCLASRSFFQDFKKDADGNIHHCKMHDMVHDFVQFLTKSEFVTEESFQSSTLDLSSKKARHLRLQMADSSCFPMSINGAEKLRSLVAVFPISKEARHLRLQMADSSCFPMSINGAEKLRSLVAVFPSYFDTTTKAFRKLFSKSKRLRLLELSGDIKEIPGEIGNLIHLRYLTLKDCKGIENLPQEVCGLSNLQFLKLHCCPKLKKLPVGIENLINLMYLDIKYCPSLTYPKGVGKLTSLVRLSGIKIRENGDDADDAEEFSIGDLEKLDRLVDLRVELIGDAINEDEAKKAKLHNKRHLKGMHIAIRSQCIAEVEVLQALNPPSNVQVISDCAGWWAQEIEEFDRVKKNFDRSL